MPSLALTELIGAAVIDNSGAHAGRVREVAISPQESSSQISSFVIKTRYGNRVVPSKSVSLIDKELRVATNAAEWSPYGGGEGLLLLERDLLDQQIIDVHGRKVVRVNDVDIHEESGNGQLILKVGAVDVGARGAMRRLLKGVVPFAVLQPLLQKIPPRMIPWEFVDLIEIDPARRVKLKISLDRLAKLHPADIADIVEDLAPAEREAVFETLNDEVAAETLEEIDPRMQVAILSSLDSDRAADIVEEMDPDAAADLLADLPEERTEQILVQMEPEAQQDVVELLEHREETAAGRMTTEFLALPFAATVQNAIDSMREFEGGVEAVSTIYLVDSHGTLVGAVPLARLVLAEANTPMLSLTQEPLVLAHQGVGENEVAELFDKYNLQTLPVVDEHNKLTGVITSDDVISMLRAKL
jgi:flagellar motility protein MotE (MotC chaperone)/sporulation protein YlmC with PRC-barrel domain